MLQRTLTTPARRLTRPLSSTAWRRNDSIPNPTRHSASDTRHSPAERQTSAETTEPRHRDDAQRLRILQERLRQWTAVNASALRERADTFSSAAAAGFSQLGGKLNHITGYEQIEALKLRVVENEARIMRARQEARSAKTAYDEAVSRRSTSQREVNDLLQRKSSWTDQDVSRFTQLVREDHLFEQTEARTKVEAAMAEDTVEREFNELMRSILARYHEEQVWSDKIRSASTYGSLAVLGLNLVVFVLAIVLVEPWKRKRLVQTFENRVVQMNEENRLVIETGLTDLLRHLAKQEEVLQGIAQTTSVLSTENVHPPGPADEDQTLIPTRTAKAMGNRDFAIAALATGGALAGVIGWVLGASYQ